MGAWGGGPGQQSEHWGLRWPVLNEARAVMGSRMRADGASCDKNSFLHPRASGPGPGAQHLVRSTAENKHQARPAVSVPPTPAGSPWTTGTPHSPQRKAPTRRSRCPAGRLWAPALTKGGLRVPGRRTHASTRTYTDAARPREHTQTCPQTHGPLVPMISPPQRGPGHLGARATWKISLQVASCSQRSPLWRQYSAGF